MGAAHTRSMAQAPIASVQCTEIANLGQLNFAAHDFQQRTCAGHTRAKRKETRGVNGFVSTGGELGTSRSFVEE